MIFPFGHLTFVYEDSSTPNSWKDQLDNTGSVRNIIGKELLGSSKIEEQDELLVNVSKCKSSVKNVQTCRS